MDGLNEVLNAWLTEDEYILATEQHRAYRAGEGVWARKGSAVLACNLSAHGWWLQCGTGAPELQKVALKVLSQPSSSSGCERNWSTFGFIHSASRNRLLPARPEKLVYVHSNLRLLRKLTAVDYAAKFPNWPSSDSEGEEDAASEADDSANDFEPEDSESEAEEESGEGSEEGESEGSGEEGDGDSD